MAEKKATTRQIVDQFKKSYDYYSTFRTKWDEYEALIVSVNKESTKNTTKSQIFDPKLITMQFDRSWRVMAQMQTGHAQETSTGDKGKATLMDLILKNYIEINANSQRDILTKFRLLNFYSNIYGSMGVLVDYIVKDSYVGPDFWLLPIRDLVLQPTKATVEDCDYVFVVNRVSRKFIESLKKNDKWNKEAVDKLLKVSKGDKKTSFDDDKSYIEKKSGTDYTEEESEFAMIKLATRYTKERWVTFAVDYPDVESLRDIENPHKNGKIPVVVKDSIPLLDRFPGTSDVERGLSLQYADNSLWNLYLDAVKATIFPPIIIKPNEVVTNTIKYGGAAEKWLLQPNGNADSIRTHNFTPQGINTFQSTHPALVAAMLNLGGTTDTTVSAVTDPSLGKTPAAINATMEKQNARDVADRLLQEQAVSKIYDIFIDLLLAKQEKPIELNIFGKELEQLAETNPDVMELLDFNEKGGIMISPDKFKNSSFKYYIDSGSTFKKNEAQEKQAVTEIVQLIFQIPGAIEQAMQTGQIRIGEKALDFGELIKRVIVTSGLQDSEKVIVEGADVIQPEPEQPMEQPMDQMMGQDQMLQEQTMAQQMPQQMMPQAPQGVNFEDPAIRQVWESIVNRR